MSAANRLTRKGQVTIPVATRRKLALQPGDQVEFVETDHDVVVRKVDRDVEALVRWIDEVKGTADLGGLTVDEWLDDTRAREPS